MRKRRLATPNDLDLTLSLNGTLRQPPVVYNRDLHIEFAVTGGRVRSPDGTPTENVLPLWTFTAMFSSQSVTEAEFTWIVQMLDRWADAEQPLTFVAAPRRVAAFYAESGDFVPFPAVSL